MSESFGLSLAGGRVTVISDVPATSRWLREMLVPGFAVVEPSDDDVVVEVGTPSPDLVIAAEEPGLMPCFALDREVVSLPGRRADSTVVLDDDVFRARYTVSPRRVHLAPAGGPRLLGASFRIIRELAVITSASAQRVQLHASAIVDRGRAVLFAGPKAAGKTTLLARVASSAGVPIAANDRALVAHEPSGWVAHGVPTIVRIRRPTVDLLPDVEWPVPGLEQPVMSTIDELESAAPSTEPRHLADEIIVSLAQLARATRVNLVAGAPLASVAVVGLDEAASVARTRRLSTDEAVARLEMVRFGVHTEPRGVTVLEEALGHRTPPTIRPDVVARLAREVPCFEVGIGPAFVSSEGAARALLDDLLGS